MKKHLFFIIFTLFILFSSEISAQSISLIPNPDTCGRVGDFDSGLYPIIFNNTLFFLYEDSINCIGMTGRFLLAKYDGLNITSIPHPVNGSTFYGWIKPIVFNNALYMVYKNLSDKLQLAKYDGSNITLIPNPDNGNVLNYFTIYNNALYFSYYDTSSVPKCQIAKYDGINVTLIPNPDNGRGLYYSNLVVFNNSLYFAYANSSNVIQLAKYDGSNVTLIPNPTTDGDVDGFDLVVYNNALCFAYDRVSTNQLVKYDGSNFTLIPNPYNGSINLNEDMYIIFNNALYFTYYNSSAKYQLAKYDGINLTLIPNPTNGNGWNYSNLIAFNNALYFQYKDASYNKDQLAKYDGSNVTLFANPNTFGGLGNSGGQHFVVFNNELYFQYHDTSYMYNLAKFNGSNITLITNPNNTALGGVCRYGHWDEPFEQIVFNNALYFPYTTISYADSSCKVQLAKYNGASFINELGINNVLNIFPNPSNDYITIEQNKELINAKLEIFNINGQLLMQQRLQNIKTTIDVNPFSKGMYFIKVITEKEITVEKFIKE